MADKNRQRVSLVIPADLHEKIKERAGDNHRSVNGEIVAILENQISETAAQFNA